MSDWRDTDMETCPACNGDGGDHCTGHAGGEPVYAAECPRCGGTGEVQIGWQEREHKQAGAPDRLDDMDEEIPF